MTNYKVQLEAKDAAHKQALVKLEHYQKTADELSIQLKSTEMERDMFIDECREARAQIGEFNSKMKEMADQLLDAVNTREQLADVLSELKATQGELLSKETELAVARDSNIKAVTQAERMQNAANMEKEKTQELLRRVLELREAIAKLSLAAAEADKKNLALLSEKDAEIALATAAAVQAQSKLKGREQVEMTEEVESQIMTKSAFIDRLQLELKQANELLRSAEKSASDAINNLDQLRADLEVKERKNLDQSVYIEALDMELKQLKAELKNSDEEVGRLACVVETLTGELQKVKTEMDEVRGRDTEAQIEVALLKAELHKGKSRIAAAEAAEARAMSAKAGLYLAVRQLAVEVQEAKKENHRLRQGGDQAAEQTDKSALVNFQSENSFQDVEASQTDELKAENEEKRDEDDGGHIAISLKEYECLVTKAEKADHIHVALGEDAGQLTTTENKHELENLKKELEVAMAKVGELRTRAEQALSRAEQAEKAKAELEDRLKRRREKKQRRKAALAALREEYPPKELNPAGYDKRPTTYQPLGKALNMKF